ncbi:MAG TPA: hypothetical protein VHI13_08510 [Candidatus Kapabacteria bacterium]|nr:hypothetical protein [Candidatus Kapabacteria bacterium]
MPNPEGHYSNVYVNPIQGSGRLVKGTGTYSSFGVFSAGTFDSGDLPTVDQFYNINGVFDGDGKTYEFPGVKCVHAGATSDFK